MNSRDSFISAMDVMEILRDYLRIMRRPKPRQKTGGVVVKIAGGAVFSEGSPRTDREAFLHQEVVHLLLGYALGFSDWKFAAYQMQMHELCMQLESGPFRISGVPT